LTFKSEVEIVVYTKCGILEIFKKPGLVDETLSNLPDLTPDRLCHY